MDSVASAPADRKGDEAPHILVLHGEMAHYQDAGPSRSQMWSIMITAALGAAPRPVCPGRLTPDWGPIRLVKIGVS